MFSRFALFITSVALLAASVMLGHRELTATTVLSRSEAQFFEAAVSSEIALPASYRAIDEIVKRCVNVVGGLYGALQPPEATLVSRTSCLSLASEAILKMPTYPLGWYAKSLFSDQLNMLPAANAALAQAQILGRHEQWIAEGRVQLAENRYATLSPDARSGHEQDLQLLARSARGVRSIAHRYVSQPDFRERITEVVEKLTPEEQTRFLNNVGHAARTFGMEIQ